MSKINYDDLSSNNYFDLVDELDSVSEEYKHAKRKEKSELAEKFKILAAEINRQAGFKTVKNEL